MHKAPILAKQGNPWITKTDFTVVLDTFCCWSRSIFNWMSVHELHFYLLNKLEEAQRLGPESNPHTEDHDSIFRYVPSLATNKTYTYSILDYYRTTAGPNLIQPSYWTTIWKPWYCSICWHSSSYQPPEKSSLENLGNNGNSRPHARRMAICKCHHLERQKVVKVHRSRRRRVVGSGWR